MVLIGIWRTSIPPGMQLSASSTNVLGFQSLMRRTPLNNDELRVIVSKSSGIWKIKHHYGSSRSRMFFKIGVLKIFGGLKACNFIKKRLQHRLFFCEYCEIFKNNFLYKTNPVAASVIIREYSSIFYDKTIVSYEAFRNCHPQVFL